MDGSGSMTCKDDGQNSRWDLLVQQLHSFVGSRNSVEGDCISVIQYSNKAQVHSHSKPMSEGIKILNDIKMIGGGT